MGTMRFIFYCSTLISLASFSGSVIINGSNLRSFACFGKNSTKHPCRVLGFVPALPDRLRSIYKSQRLEVRKALDSGDLTILSENELASLHPALLLLIPNEELTRVGGEKLAFLLDMWSGERAVLRHILSAVLLNDNIGRFIEKVRNMELDDETFDMIGDNLSLDRSPQKLGPLLLHLPFLQIFNIPKDKRLQFLVFLKLMVSNNGWNTKRLEIHRTWTKILVDEDFPKPLHMWTDLDILSIGRMLIGAKPSELLQIDGKKLVDKDRLFNLGFDALQVRALFAKVYKDTDLSSMDFRDLRHNLVKLLPSQLQRFSNKKTEFRSLQITPPVKSLATSTQVIQFLLREGKNLLPRRLGSVKEILFIGRMVHALPLTVLSLYRDEPLQLNQLLHLQSQHLTNAQVYYLLGKGRDLDISSSKFQEVTTYLHALPSSKMNTELSASQVRHLMLHIPSDNIPRLGKFLHIASSTTGRHEIAAILEKPDRLKILDILPTKLLMKAFEELPQSIGAVSNELNPAWFWLSKKLVTSLNRSLKGKSFYTGLGNESHINLIYDLNCNDISKLSTPDFILDISKYRKLIKMTNQAFPKELQHCTAGKLIEYLKLKSILRQQFIDDTLLTLLSPEEIEAVGGWILTSLATEDIISSANLKDIVRQIGAMSATEIFTSAPLLKMRTIVYNFLAMQESMNRVNAKELSFLGNLTMVMTEDLIGKIEIEAFKVLLEGSYFDTRICATLSERNAWSSLILKAFGPTKDWTGEEINILGNMLIALKEDILKDIPSEAWIQVADIVEIGYFDRVENFRDTTYLQVCQTFLPASEAEKYASSVKALIGFYFRAALLQLNTVKTFTELWPNNDAIARREMLNDEPLKNESSFQPSVIGLEQDNRSSDKVVARAEEQIVSGILTNDPEKSSKVPENDSTLFDDDYSIENEQNDSEVAYDSSDNMKNPNNESNLKSQSDNSSELVLPRNAEQVDLGEASLSNTPPLDDENDIVEPLPSDSLHVELKRTAQEHFLEERVTHNPADTSLELKEERATHNPTDTSLELKEERATHNPADTSLELKEERVTHNPADTSLELKEERAPDLFTVPGEMEEETNSSLLRPNVSDGKNSVGPKKVQLKSEQQDKIEVNASVADQNGSGIEGRNANSHEGEIAVDLTAPLDQNGSEFEGWNANSHEGEVAVDLMAPPDQNESEFEGRNANSHEGEVTVDLTAPLDQNGSEFEGRNANTHEGEVVVDLMAPPDQNESEFEGWNANTHEGEVAVDLMAALEEIDKEEHPDYSEPQEHPDHEQAMSDHVDDSHFSETSSGDMERKVFQPLSMPMSISPKKKLDNLPKETDPNIYENLSDALKAISEIENVCDDSSTEISADVIEPVGNYVDRNEKVLKKRSVTSYVSKKILCAAMKTVGKAVEHIITEEIVNSMSDEELLDCVELFAKMELPKPIQQLIWTRINKTDLHLMGRLVAVTKVEDLVSFNFNPSEPWVLEAVHTLSKFNTDPSVAKLILTKMFEYTKELKVEEAISLGKLICNIPNLNDVLSPTVLLKSSVVLGSALPCDQCLNAVASIASKNDAFGPTTQWNYLDIKDLGIIVAGLRLEKWVKLMETNPDVLYGLQPNAGKCLSLPHIEAIPAIHVQKIPYFTRLAIGEKIKLSSSSQVLLRLFTKYDDITLRNDLKESSLSTRNHLSVNLLHIMIITTCIRYYYFS